MLKDECKKLGITLPLSDNTEVLKKEITVEGKRIPNRLAVQPMEGCDGENDGSVSELVFRRYERFARGGAGLIWAEATAVVPEGRANPRQLYINENNTDPFKRLVHSIKETCIKHNGFEPLVICQLTHSGRHSKPNGVPEPIIAYNNPIFEKDTKIDASRIASDEYLGSLAEKYAFASRLAERCGFDGADIKCCHGYLFAEILCAHTRDNNIYGGSFENRTRLYLDTVKAVKESVSSGFIVTSRLGIYDGYPHPYGFGNDEKEVMKLVDILQGELGISMLNITLGNPYANPHMNRPFNKGPYAAPENALLGVHRMMSKTKLIKDTFPKLTIVSSAHSFLGVEAPSLAAGALESGVSDIAGFGRMAIAYPDFANDILNGSFDKRKVCLACSKCSELMRAGTVSGCVVRDSEIYLPKYKENCIK